MANHSRVSISNLALAALGADLIRDFDEDNKRARMCAVFFPIVRDYLLTRFDWTFARGFEWLQEESLTPEQIPFGTKGFKLPSICKIPRDILPYGSKDKWEVMGSTLFCEKEEVGLIFTRNDVVTSKFSDVFVDLLFTGMCARMAMSITQDRPTARFWVEQAVNMMNMDYEPDANIGNIYKEYDNDPNHDTFVYPGGFMAEHPDFNK